MNIATFKMVPADMGGGTAYIGGERGLGEIGFNFKVVTKSDDYFLATSFDASGIPTAGGYFVAKFTEASSSAA